MYSWDVLLPFWNVGRVWNCSDVSDSLLADFSHLSLKLKRHCSKTCVVYTWWIAPFFNVSWTSDSIRTLFSWLSLGVTRKTSLLETVFPRTKFCNLEQLTGYLCPELILLNLLNDIIAFPLEEMTEFLNLTDFSSKDETFSKSISISWAMLGLRCYLYSYLGRVLLTMYWQRILAAATIDLSVL